MDAVDVDVIRDELLDIAEQLVDALRAGPAQSAAIVLNARRQLQDLLGDLQQAAQDGQASS